MTARWLDSSPGTIPATAPAGPDPALGAVFTRPWVADMILDLVGYTADADLTSLVAVEPACGHGAFVVPMARRLLRAASRSGVQPAELGRCLRAFDLDPDATRVTRNNVRAALQDGGVSPEVAAALARRWIRTGDYLQSPVAAGTVDVVVGNPPYVRLEHVPPARYARYRQDWPTMRGRADIYVGFFEAGLRALRPGGRLAYICADRWMHAQYGAALRAHVSARYAVRAVLRMHDADAFHDAVNAYPAVAVIERGKQGPVFVAEAGRDFGTREAAVLVRDNAKGPVPRAVSDASAWLPHWYQGAGGWPAASPARLAVLAELEQRLPLIQDTGVRIGVGVATGADKVFITDEPPDVEADRLLPLAMAADTATTAVTWSGSYLVNPWGDTGLVDLDDYPRLRGYLLRHEAALRRRRVARDRPSAWWRTIDRVHPQLAAHPKLLIADLRARIQPSLDEGRYYPQHNLVYVTSAKWDLQVLGGLLLSDVASLIVEAYSPRMANGYLRVTTQYLRRVRVPPYEAISSGDRLRLARAFVDGDRTGATRAALGAYGLPGDALG